MIIAIPTYKRADNCVTARNLSKAVIFCHEFEVEDYKKNYSNDIIAIPDELKGTGMGVIRNFILDECAGEDVVMLDDDVYYIGYYENLELIKLEEEEVYEFFEDNFRLAREMGTVLWGLNLQSDKKFYREYSPFSLSSVVLAPCFGIIKDKDIRFDESLGLKEDYDYSLQVLRKHRKILRFNKFHYSCGHIGVKGGCSSYRTRRDENEQAERFEAKWGSRIVKIKRLTQGGNTSINPVVNSPIKGI